MMKSEINHQLVPPFAGEKRTPPQLLRGNTRSKPNFPQNPNLPNYTPPLEMKVNRLEGKQSPERRIISIDHNLFIAPQLHMYG